MLLCVHLGLVVWTLIRFSQIEHWSPGIQFFGNEVIDTKGLTKSTVSNLQEGTWFHLVRVLKDGGVTVKLVAEGSPAAKVGLQSGDLITSINNIDLRSNPEAYFQSRLQSDPGDIINLTWLRDGQVYSGVFSLEKIDRLFYATDVNQQELVMGVVAMTWFQRGPFLIYPIILLFFGTWMGFRSPHNYIAFRCALLFLTTALSTSSAFHPMIAGWPQWILTLSIVLVTGASFLKSILIVNILSVFPNETVFGFWLRRWARLILIPILVSCVLSLLYFLSLTHGWNNELVRFVVLIVEPFPEPTQPIIVVIVVSILLKSQRSVARRQQRMRLHVLEIGFILALVIAPMWAVIQPGTQLATSELLPIQGWGLPLIVWFLDSMVRIGFQCALPISFAYTILAHRVFGIKFAFRNSLRYMVKNQSTYLILFFGVLVVVYELICVWPVGAITSDLVVAFAVAGLILILLGGWTRVKNPALRLMDRYLFSEEFDRRQRLYRLERTLSSFRDRGALVESIGRELLEGLDLYYVVFYFYDQPHCSLSVVWFSVNEVPGQALAKDEHHFTKVSTTVEKTLLKVPPSQLLIEYGDPNTDGLLTESGFELFLVINYDSSNRGCIALGAKRSEEPFSSDEKERLLVLIAEMELALKNIEMAASLIQQAQGLKKLTRRLINVQESERSRLSRDLHDDAGQTLTALKISLELTSKELTEDNDHAKERLKDALKLTEEAMVKLRTTAHGLRPPTLDTIGLNAALEGQCMSFTQQTGILVVYNGVDLPDVSDMAGICFYRILQEGLTNCAKHGKATRVEVNLVCKNHVIELSIVDNGKGFVPHSKTVGQSKVGIGLIDMHERLESLKGNLYIRSEPGNGTLLIASIPMEGK